MSIWANIILLEIVSALLAANFGRFCAAIRRLWRGGHV